MIHRRRRVAVGAELLAQERIARSRPRQLVPDQLLGRVVRLRDRREVGLGVDLQVMRAKPAQA